MLLMLLLLIMMMVVMMMTMKMKMMKMMKMQWRWRWRRWRWRWRLRRRRWWWWRWWWRWRWRWWRWRWRWWRRRWRWWRWRWRWWWGGQRRQYTFAAALWKDPFASAGNKKCEWETWRTTNPALSRNASGNFGQGTERSRPQRIAMFLELTTSSVTAQHRSHSKYSNQSSVFFGLESRVRKAMLSNWVSRYGIAFKSSLLCRPPMHLQALSSQTLYCFYSYQAAEFDQPGCSVGHAMLPGFISVGVM